MSIKDKTVQGLTNVENFVTATIEMHLCDIEDGPNADTLVSEWQSIQDELRETLTNARTLVSCVTAH